MIGDRLLSTIGRLGGTATGDRVAFGTAAVGLAAGALLSWLVTPLQGGIRGYSFPLLGEVLLADARARPLRLASFGTAALVLALLVGVAAWRRWRRAGFWLGAVAVLLSLHLAGTVALRHSEILQAVVEQNVQRINMKAFDNITVGGVASRMYVSDLGTDSLAERIGSSIWVYGFGWQLVLSSGLFLLAWVLARQGWRLKWDLVGVGVLVLLLLGALGSRAVVGEYWVLRGHESSARGSLTDARASYERALAWDPALAHNPALQHSLGAVYSLLEILNRPPTYIYRGDLYLGRGDFEQARQNYEQALAIQQDQPVALRGRVNTRVEAGRADYRSGEIHKAIAEWERALEIDRGQVQVPFFLGRAFFDVRRDRMAIQAGEGALERTADQLVRADIYIVLGDAHYRLRDFVRAREMYQNSLNQYPSVTFLLNWLARQRLQGI